MATETTVAAPARRKLKPARKQVEVDEIDRSEKVQPGKEYSQSRSLPGCHVECKADRLRLLVQQVGWWRQGGCSGQVSLLIGATRR